MQRPLQITFKDMERSETVEALVRERVDKLERFHPAIVGCRIVVEVPYRAAGGGKQPLAIAVEVELPGRPMIVARSAGERQDAKGGYAALINRVFDAAQRQLHDMAEVQKAEIKQHENAGATGQVVRLFPEQGYGFIEVRGSPDLYFARDVVTGGSFADLTVGTLVHVIQADTEGPMGPQASSVKLRDAQRSVA
jgi:hypothetical protein